MICWLVAFRAEIRRTDVEILAVALAFFAILEGAAVAARHGGVIQLEAGPLPDPD